MRHRLVDTGAGWSALAVIQAALRRNEAAGSRIFGSRRDVHPSTAILKYVRRKSCWLAEYSTGTGDSVRRKN